MIKILLFVIFTSLILSQSCYSFDDETTHRALTERAADVSIVPDYLKRSMRFPLGLTLLIKNRTITEWLREGSYLEDEPDTCRASNHFHNPLEAWNQSYMSDEPGYISDRCSIDEYKTKYSSITWGTGYESRDGERIHRIGQRMGWDDARNYFHKALIANIQSEREDYIAKTFQALGQVMHLLQDMAVPAHVRNDFESHMEFIEVNGINIRKWFDNRFEIYVRGKTGLVASAGVNKPNFLDPKSVRLTDFWDTDRFQKGGRPPVKNDFSFGLAEHVNANYFSKYTIPNNNPSVEHRFSSPALSSSYYICEDYKSNSTKKRKYISRKPCSLPSEERTVDHFAAVSSIDWWRVSNENIPSLRLWLDENVHNTYAKELLPLAIGYSASLLDYFFRGDIEISLPDDGFYAMTQDGNQGFSKVTLMARNISPNDEEMPDGKIHLVIHYKEALEDPFQNKEVPTTEFKYIVVPERNGVKAIPRDEPVKLEFDLSAAKLLPVIATDLYLQVVYRGTLGLETDAVVVGLKDVREPTPIDIFNDMDKICVDKTWWDAGSKEVIDLMDSDGDEYPDLGDVFPHNLENYLIRFSPFESPRYVSPEQYHIKFDLIKAGESIRGAYVISDEKFYVSYSGRVEKADPIDGYGHWYHHCFPNEGCLYYTEGVKNQAEYLPPDKCKEPNSGQGCYERVPPPFIKYWGEDIWFGIVELLRWTPFPQLCKGYPGD